MELTRLAAARLGKTVIELEDVTVRAGRPRTLLDDVTWQLGPGDRIGVVGVNGSGKTTLLRVLADALPLARPRSSTRPRRPARLGRMIRGSTVRLGYLTQEPVPVDPYAAGPGGGRAGPRLGRRSASGSCPPASCWSGSGCGGDRQWTPVGELSGGERRRLQLLLMLLAEPNVLLLDEPTNDLDIETLTELEDLLDGWPGSVVAVSHDRYFLERVTDHVVALVDGQVAFLPGGVDEYLERRAAAARAAARRPGRRRRPAPPGRRRPPPGRRRGSGPGRRSWPGWSARSAS